MKDLRHFLALIVLAAMTAECFAVHDAGTVIAWGCNDQYQTNVPPGLSNVIAIAAGGDGCLALKGNGTVVQWGELNLAYLQPPADLTNVVAISEGADPFWLALKNDGTVRAWGGNDDGCSTVPPGLSNVVAIAAGYCHSLALKSDGTVVAWGDNSSGQTNVPNWLSNVVAISAYEFQSLALRSDGTVVGWGDNFEGESTGVSTMNHTNGVVTVNNQVLNNVVAIAAGDDSFSLGLKADGSIAYWGDSYGFAAKIPPGLTNAAAITAGGMFAFALKSDGTVVPWGFDFHGATNVPVGLTNVVAVAAGLDHGVALFGGAPPAAYAPLTNAVRRATSFSVSVPMRSGRVYRLEYKDSLSARDWVPLPLVSGRAGVNQLTDSAATVSQRFYRVRQW
jgi:alpha-tubulin suppressor-like RCC1 family protein